MIVTCAAIAVLIVLAPTLLVWSLTGLAFTLELIPPRGDDD